MRYVCVLSAIVLFAASAFGGQPSTVTGSLTKSTPTDFSGVSVELREIGLATAPAERAYVSHDGHFEMRNVPSGQYLLTVLALNGEIISQQYVTVQPFGQTINISLDNRKKNRPVSGVVSVKQLLHQPSKRARKIFAAAVHSKEVGDTDRAQQLLEEALRLEPDFVEALNNLGAQYVIAERFAEAAKCFEHAIRVAPQMTSLHANLALTQFRLDDPEGAEQSARKLLEIDQRNQQGAYLLGLSLLLQNKITPETISHLKRGKDLSPRATLAFALALAQTGAIADARTTLVPCLKAPEPAVRFEAERLLSRLR